jgi:isopenicillin-N N-acyltransferase-like protein
VEAFPYFEFSGNNREIGRQHGRQAGDYVHRHLDMALGKLAVRDVDQQLARQRARAYIPYIQRHAPHFAEELRGLAEGAEVSEEDAYILQLRAELAVNPGIEMDAVEATRAREAIAHECTSFAVSGALTADGQPLAGQNADLPAGTLDIAIVARVQPDGKPSFLMLLPAGQISYIGINDRGLGVFANFLNTDGWRPGFPRYLLSRTVLEHDSIGDALDRLQAIPRASSRNVLIIDRDGRSVSMEYAVDAAGRLEPEDGLLVHTNHFVDPAVAACERAEGDRLANSCTRLARMRELLDAERGDITPESVMSAFRDRVHAPDAICRHLGDGPGDYITFASVIARPSSGDVWIAPGPPDQNAYTHYALASS